MPQKSETTIQSYVVAWTIDLDAPDPIRAAALALEIHRRLDSIATVFEVTAPDGTTTRVDLPEGTAEIVSAAR